MQDENSSSASANNAFFCAKIDWTSPGILKIYPEEGPSFFVRDEYVPTLLERLVFPNISLTSEDFDTLFLGARAWLAEKSAMTYLARAEHCRKQLELKLRKKDFLPSETSYALDYLESKGYLDDARFCEAWLRSRLLHKAEGPSKLLAALQNRGIAYETAKKAVNEFFLVNDEEALCQKAIEKLKRRGKSGIKLAVSLNRAGFSTKLISKYIKMLK